MGQTAKLVIFITSFSVCTGLATVAPSADANTKS